MRHLNIKLVSSISTESTEMNPLNYFFCFPALFHLLNTSENFNASEKIIIGFTDVIFTVTDVIHLIIGFTCETQK